MVSRAFYEEKLNAALAETKSEIERLTSEGDSLVDEQLLKGYQERADQIEDKIRQLGDTDSEEDSSLWQKLKAEMDDIFSTMGAGFENISAKNETDAVIRSLQDKEEEDKEEVDEEEEEWQMTSFTIIDGATAGWGQFNPTQIDENQITGVEYNSDLKSWQFITSDSPIDIVTFGADFPFDLLHEAFCLFQLILGNGEAHIRVASLAGVLNDHVHHDAGLGQRREDLGRQTRLVRHSSNGNFGLFFIAGDPGYDMFQLFVFLDIDQVDHGIHILDELLCEGRVAQVAADNLDISQRRHLHSVGVFKGSHAVAGLRELRQDSPADFSSRPGQQNVVHLHGSAPVSRLANRAPMPP